jgi:hypothetical protein
MATKKSRRKRHRILALAAAGAVALVVVLIVAAVWIMIRQPDKTQTAVPPTAVPPTSAGPTTKARPEFQDASCPDVQLMSIPGTWESSPQLDPFNPTQFPIALLLNVTNPIREQFGTDRVEIYTVPYTAQFHNPLSADQQMSYNDSRAEGTRNAVKAMTDMNNRCPLTSYLLVGFSQGAVIAGDMASDIGNGRGPVDADLVLGVTLIADGRRQTGVGMDVGPNPVGQGAEITLHEVPTLRDGADDVRRTPRRLRPSQRPHQRDLRVGRPDLLGPPGGVLDHQSAEDDGDPRRRRRPAGTRHVQHDTVLEYGWPTRHSMDTGLVETGT